MRSLIRTARAAVAAALLIPAALRAQALPDAKTLMDKHNTAIGGRAAFDKYSTVHMTAIATISSMGMDANMEIYRAKPNKLLQKVIIGPVGEILTGFDGKVGWTTNPMQGAQVLDGELLAALRNQADFFANLQDVAAYTTAQTVELTDFEGNKCYKVKVIREGRDGFEYFNAENGLLAGFSGTQATAQGSIASTTVFREYGEWGGLKFPKKIEQMGGPAGTIITFSAVEFDKVDAAVFELPAAVKALIKP